MAHMSESLLEATVLSGNRVLQGLRFCKSPGPETLTPKLDMSLDPPPTLY